MDNSELLSNIDTNVVIKKATCTLKTSQLGNGTKNQTINIKTTVSSSPKKSTVQKDSKLEFLTSGKSNGSVLTESKQIQDHSNSSVKSMKLLNNLNIFKSKAFSVPLKSEENN